MTSSAFNECVRRASRTFRVRFLKNGEPLNCEVKKVVTRKGACTEEFSPGMVYAPYIDAELLSCEASIENEELLLQTGLYLDDGTVEYINMGYFTVTKPERNAFQTTFQAVGRISSRLNVLPDLPEVKSLSNLANAITEKTGIRILTKGLTLGGTIAADLNGMTCREILEVMTSVLGGFATEDGEGNIVICKFSTTSLFEYNGDYVITPPKFNDYNYTVNGIKVVASSEQTDEDGNAVTETAYTEGSPKLTLLNEFMTEELFEFFAKNIVGYSFRPGEMQLTLGDPRIEPWDCISYTDVAGTTYTLPCLNLVHTFDGGFSTEITAKGKNETESDLRVKGPLQKQVERLNAELFTVKDAVANRIKAEAADLRYARVGRLDAVEAHIRVLEADTLKTEELEAAVATLGYVKVSDLEANYITAARIESEYATVESLHATDATVGGLVAAVADIEEITARAITTDNLSASVATLGYAKVEDLEATNAELDNLTADAAEIANVIVLMLEAQQADIESLTAKDATLESLISGKAAITDLNATNATVSNLSSEVADFKTITTEKLDAQDASIQSLTSKNANLESLISQKASLGDLNATNANLENLTADAAEFMNLISLVLEAQQVDIDSLSAKDAEIEDLVAEKATIEDLNSANADISNLRSRVATIEGAYITTAKVNTLFANYTTTTDLKANYATINSLSAATARIGTLESSTVKATELEAKVATFGYLKSANLESEVAKFGYAKVTSLEAVDAKFETLSSTYATVDLANVKAGSITTAMIGSGVVGTAQIADGSITDAKIVGLTANKITAGTLDAGTIEVINLNAANITVGTINGQQIAAGAIDITKLTNTLNSTISSASTNASQALTNAANAQATADKSYEKVISKGEQLIVNGNGMMGNNTNFSSWTYDGTVGNDSPGSFTRTAGSGGTLYSDEYFLVSTNNTYTFSFDAKSLLGKGTMYSFLMFYDVDKNAIVAPNHMYHPGSTTTLAKDLKAGDTVIYLTDVSGWSTSVSYGFYLAIWNYKNSKGYTYPPESYTRNRITLPKTSSNTLDSSKINFTAKTITLASPYSGSTIPAGTSVSQGRDGGTYKYMPIGGTVIPVTWTTYSGKMIGVDYSGNNVGNKFPPGVAYARIGFLWNYNNASGEQQWITNITVTDTTAIDKAQDTADSKNTVFYQTSAPSTSGRKNNDIWFDTDDGNKMYFWNGTEWSAKQFGTNAIASASITNALIADATIQSAKIASLDAGKITTGTLDASRIAAGSISTSHLGAGAITAEKISSGAVTAEKISSGAVTTDKLVTESVTAAKIASKTITANQIAAGTITGTEISANSINAGHISSGAITTEKLNAKAVTAEKINIEDLFAQNITASNLHVTGKSTFSGALNGATGSFEGSITATSGYIGPFQIHKDGLYASFNNDDRAFCFRENIFYAEIPGSSADKTLEMRFQQEGDRIYFKADGGMYVTTSDGFHVVEDGTGYARVNLGADGNAQFSGSVYEGGLPLSSKYASATHTHSYLPLSGGSMNNAATIKLTQYGCRHLTIDGNSLNFDLSADTGGWAIALANIYDATKTNTTLLGAYGGTSGVNWIYMGGSYSDPHFKITPDGTSYFKNTPYVGNTLVSLAGHTHDYLTAFAQSAYNANSCYDAGLYMVASGANLPSSSPYGSLLTLPYRKRTGNETPDFGTQIFIPNGDDGTKANSMFYRTSLQGSWNAWQEVATKSDIASHTHALDYRLQAAQSTATGSDANSATATGFHYINGTTNRPSFSQSSNVDYRILTTAYSATWLQQIATDFRCDDIFYRRCQNGLWQSWRRLAFADECATAGHTHSYLPLSGGTLSGILNISSDKAQINLRPGHASYDGVISYQTSGNEAMVFSTKQAVTSFMFVNGEDTIANISAARWQSVTPGLHIKQNCVAIGKLIANGVTPNYKLEVAGTIYASSTIYENGTALANKYAASDHTHGTIVNGDGYGAAVGVYYASSGSSYRLRYSGDYKWYIGGTSHRWDTIYAVNALNTSSDIRLKKEISNDMDKYIQVLDLMQPITFSRTNDDSNKRHAGYSAQGLEYAMNAVGLPLNDFAGLSKEWDEEMGDWSYGIVYEEFIPVIHAKVNKVEIQLNARISSLEARLEQKDVQLAQAFDKIAKQQKLIDTLMAA